MVKKESVGGPRVGFIHFEDFDTIFEYNFLAYTSFPFHLDVVAVYAIDMKL